jgi:uncharacterized BrkB/YihY/UPF0761 family membrane protein
MNAINKKLTVSVFIGGFSLFYLLFIVVAGISEMPNGSWLRFIGQFESDDSGYSLFTTPVPFLLIYTIMYFLFRWVFKWQFYR